MRVLIDGSIYSTAPHGGAYIYLNELIPRLARCPQLQVELVTPSKTALPVGVESSAGVHRDWIRGPRWFPQGRVRQSLGHVRRALEARLWGVRTARYREAVYHSVYYVPFPGRRLPQVSLVHDMIPYKFADLYPESFGKTLREKIGSCVQASTRFITVSGQTKRDLCTITGVDPARVDVIHHGFQREVFQNTFQDPTLQKGPPYLLYVGGRLNHKNFPRLLEAFAGSRLHRDYVLKVAGFAWTPEELALLAKWNLKDRVELVEAPSTKYLALLYKHAAVFVYPSLYEGFGLPTLEAMASGCPVAGARAGSIPEIGGEAALYFDPTNPTEMAQVIERLTDRTTADHHRRLGLKQCENFSWEKAATETVLAYQKTLAEF